MGLHIFEPVGFRAGTQAEASCNPFNNTVEWKFLPHLTHEAAEAQTS